MSSCAFCDSKNYEILIDFGEMALAGGFLKKESFASEKKYPMTLIYCKDCGSRLYQKGNKSSKSGVWQKWYQCKMYHRPQYEKDIIKWESGMRCDKSYKGNYINKDLFEDIVWESLFYFLSKSKDLKRELKEKYKNELKIKDSSIGKKKYYIGLIEDLEDKKFKLYNEKLDGKIRQKDFDSFSSKFNEEIEKHNNRISELEANIGNYNKVANIDFESINELVKRDLELKYSLNSKIERIRLFDKYINKLYLKRLGDQEYKLIFDLKFNLEDNSNAAEVVVDKDKNSYIKKLKIYLKDSYIGNLRLKIEFGIKINKKLRGRDLMLVSYSKEILGVDVI